MPCFCTINTLRLFVRNVAQIEVPSIAKSLPPKRYQPHSFRGLTTPAVRRLHSSTRAASANSPSNHGAAHLQTSEDIDEGKIPSTESSNADYAAVEFSPEAIDAIAAESRLERAGDAPVAELQSDAIFQKDESPMVFLDKSIYSNQIKEKRRAERLKLRPSNRAASRSIDLSNTQRGSSKWEERKPREPARSEDRPRAQREHWQIDKAAIKAKYPEGWSPRKKLSPDAMAGIRALHAQFPDKYNARTLADQFEVSPEAISRILRSKWAPSAEEETDRMRRWFKRGESVWGRYAELGLKPPKKWRELGIGRDYKEKRAQAQDGSPTKPALVTLPRREGGTYKLDEDDDRDGFEDKLL